MFEFDSNKCIFVDVIINFFDVCIFVDIHVIVDLNS